ncbi:hypothetical protein CsSME_00034807 [Camellia sinensis var. sinensis]
MAANLTSFLFKESLINSPETSLLTIPTTLISQTFPENHPNRVEPELETETEHPHPSSTSSPVLSPQVAAVAPQSSPAPNPIRHLRNTRIHHPIALPTRILCYPNWSLIYSPPWSAGTETPNEYSETYEQEDSGRWSEELVGELRGGIMRCSSRTRRRISIHLMPTFGEQIWITTVGSVALRLLPSCRTPICPNKSSLRYGCMLINIKLVSSEEPRSIIFLNLSLLHKINFCRYNCCIKSYARYTCPTVEWYHPNAFPKYLFSSWVSLQRTWGTHSISLSL